MKVGRKLYNLRYKQNVDKGFLRLNQPIFTYKSTKQMITIFIGKQEEIGRLNAYFYKRYQIWEIF